MADGIRIDVSTKDIEQRLGADLPAHSATAVENAMRTVVGRLYNKILDNIETMFTEAGRSKGRLADSILGTVTKEGDMVIGKVEADQAHAPYAAILEYGGVTSAHVIRPVNASMLAIHQSTMHFEWDTDGYEAIGDYLVSRHGQALVVDDFTLLYQVNHPGSKIQPYFYMNKALIELSRSFNDDIQSAIISAISDSGLKEE